MCVRIYTHTHIHIYTYRYKPQTFPHTIKLLCIIVPTFTTALVNSPLLFIQTIDCNCFE